MEFMQEAKMKMKYANEDELQSLRTRLSFGADYFRRKFAGGVWRPKRIGVFSWEAFIFLTKSRK